ncbi:HNH endonuclease [Paracoccus stylophorae]|uniref:HNH endonuclease n=2 Tax=Paracoccus stylophorae TaxID=659350 RepID=A0ABY7SVL2_9RHOB|nr:HNH endonuclease [Paracoccus stylophorae]
MSVRTPVRGLQRRMVDILWELEVASRTKLAEHGERPEGLWVEHVLPQSWGEEWPLADGDTADPASLEQETIARNAKLHTLGNLTLLSGGLNISSGNKSFKKKKKKFEEHTGLLLNKWFEKRDQWTEAEIEERGTALAELAIEIWPGLE